jgi:hypothetical protein
MAASGDPEGSAAAGNADSDTTGTNDSVSADAGNTNWPKRAPAPPVMHLLGPAAMTTGDIRDNRTRLEAFGGNLRLQIVRPALATCAIEHFNTR